MGRKVRAGVHWWAGFAPLMVRGAFNAGRFATNVPVKFQNYEYRLVADTDAGGHTEMELKFTFDPNYGDLVSAQYTRLSEFGASFEYLWDRAQGYFQNFTGGWNPGSAPWPYLDGGNLVLASLQSTIGGALWPFPTPVTVTETTATGTQTKENGDTLTVTLNVTGEVTFQAAAGHAAGVMNAMELLEVPQLFNGYLDLNYDWANPEPSRRAYDLVFPSEYSGRSALGRSPTNRVTLAFNRPAGGAIAIVGENGFATQADGWPASGFGSRHGVAVQPSGGGWRSWDWPRPEDGVMAMESLVHCPSGISCANHTSPIFVEFDYEVIWPWLPASGVRGPEYVGRGGPFPIPARVERFDLPGLGDEPGLLLRLQDAGFEVGESYIGAGTPSGMTKPAGCP